MRYAVVGVGRIGELHARLLAAIAGVEAIVVADPDQARAEQVARDLGGTAATSPAAAMDAADAVVIAAATGAHAELIDLAAARSLPTFCEKPLAPGLVASRLVAERIATSG